MKIVMARTEEVVTGAQIQNREDNVSEDEFLGPNDGKDGNPFWPRRFYVWTEVLINFELHARGTSDVTVTPWF